VASLRTARPCAGATGSPRRSSPPYALGLSRNPYDRLGHLFQGFVPALVVREVLLRTSPLRRGRWVAFLSVAVPLAFSAVYELLEWAAAVSLGQSADAFLGTQGDPWDTQWDMFTCLIGAVVAVAFVARAHDRQLARLAPEIDAVPGRS